VGTVDEETVCARRPGLLPWIYSLVAHLALAAAVVECRPTAPALRGTGPRRVELIGLVPGARPPPAPEPPAPVAPPAREIAPSLAAAPRARRPPATAPLRVIEEERPDAPPRATADAALLSLGTAVATPSLARDPGGSGGGGSGPGRSARSGVPATTARGRGDGAPRGPATATRARPPHLVWPTEDRPERPGEVFVARLTIDEDGYVVGVRMIEGMGGRPGERAEEAVWRFRYAPALDAAGRPVRTRIEQRFMLK